MTIVSSDRGMALLTAVMITAFVGALIAALVYVVVTESRVSANHQAAQLGAYAAAAGVERLVAELRPLSTWELVPSTSSVAADFNDGISAPVLADGTSLDLARLTTDRQSNSNAFYPDGPNRPVWNLYAHASLARIASAAGTTASPYVIVWVADDPDESDDDPARDSNDTILVRAEAFGVHGSWRAIEATIARSSVRDGTVGGGATISKVALIAWREAR